MNMIYFLFFFILLLTCASDIIQRRRYDFGVHFEDSIEVAVRYNSLKDDGIKWFTQKLDHSDPTNHQTWKQKYFFNEQYFNESERSVVFLRIIGENTAHVRDVTTESAIIEYAKELGALIIQVEHRYYGDSQPFDEITVEHYKYLTSEQALGDYANIMQTFNSTFKYPAQYIALGGSYAGSLAVWLRLKFPHLVSGALCSSGPVLAKLEFEEYYQAVAEDIKNVSQKCYDTIKKGFNQIIKKLESCEGRSQLSKTFKTCIPVDTNQNNTNLFLDYVTGNFAYAAQYHTDIRKMGARKKHNLKSLCEVITNETHNKTEWERVADFIKTNLNANEYSCLNNEYESMIRHHKSFVNGNNNRKAWSYQTCNEFGWLQTPEKADIFGSLGLLDFSVGICQELFGLEFNKTKIEENVVRINTIYGGFSNVIKNVVYVNGKVDPWHKISITNSNNPDAPSIFIDRTSHCADLAASSEKDGPHLTKARQQIKGLLRKWLNLEARCM